jgi:hypothetical protein
MIKFLSALHLAIVLFVIFGFLFIQKPVLIFHLIFLPILILHWRTNGGVCYITQLQNKIEPIVKPKEELQGGFSEALITKITGRQPTKLQLKKIIYGLMMVSWLISFAKVL